MKDTTLHKEYILDKIKKCLALSKSSNEHEAAAALRHAQKLMEKHGISENDLGMSEYVSGVVITDYEYKPSKTGVTVPIIVKSVTTLISRAIGVKPVFESQAASLRHMFAVRYFGLRHKVHIAVHAHTVVNRAATRAWREYSAENVRVRSKKGARAGFFMGWCTAVMDKVANLNPEGDESRLIEKRISEHYSSGTSKAKKNKDGFDLDATYAGEKLGKQFNINKPINAEQAYLEVKK